MSRHGSSFRCFTPSPLVLAAALLSPLAAPPAQAQSGGTLPDTVAQALAASGLPASSLSVWVHPLDRSGPTLSYQATLPRRMASVMKLMTTGVALRTLGPAFTWSTPVALGGPLDRQGVLRGDVFIRASGDPSLDSQRLAAWLKQWREAGLREIRGDVRIDRSVFERAFFDTAAFDGQPLKPYNAAPDAWLLAHQAVSLQLRPGPARAGQARVTLTPALAGVVLDARVRLDAQAPCGDWRTDLSVDIQANRRVRVQGRYPLACGAQSWPLLWPQSAPGEHSARVWQAAWSDAGGRLRGQVLEGAWPSPPPEPWLSWSSPPLAEVVRDINKFSNNVMARQLFLTLGRPAEGAGPASLERAREFVAAQVRQATRTPGMALSLDGGPCDGAALVLDNGSGLSRTEGASAACMGHWIAAMWHDPLMPEWLASLPLAGVDGTARRMTAVVGRAHLKTGSLDDVTAVGGMVQTPSGRRLVVVAVVNDARAEVARPVMRAVLDWAGDDR
ncbi:MAG TPA: D-alanyl-D-alanine carboxypeptidase/D-alanyl-D-alanine-endopeptidase [Aquabacterium sp.]|uniref:D-alanyl-D-alanine carboxypeptidase/D-alanyl-D-alanine endopeptidase n=1 Tax=Aquabacterium sp. TaxID=1872578 RepID=UPI002E36A37D|nr:D-alanyl-D-alanine carboxypeptidase/D-alanyl-D-alanine-endopeptidase [Aquabacterium sp.]HEX5374025.1 D-alanyl-D-alanine carboxypeptidase/D-alanyl-D-alanine-endopeptidase [Aquabacterium sp.]